MYYVCCEDGILGEFDSFSEAEEFLYMRSDNDDLWIAFEEED